VTFTASVLYDGDLCVLALAGDLDVAVTALVDASVRELLRDGLRTVVVDLTALTFCDSTGLSALLSVSRTVREAGGRAAFAGAAGAVRRLFDLMAVDGLLETAPDVGVLLREVERVPRVGT